MSTHARSVPPEHGLSRFVKLNLLRASSLAPVTEPLVSLFDKRQ